VADENINVPDKIKRNEIRMRGSHLYFFIIILTRNDLNEFNILNF